MFIQSSIYMESSNETNIQVDVCVCARVCVWHMGVWLEACGWKRVCVWAYMYCNIVIFLQN